MRSLEEWTKYLEQQEQELMQTNAKKKSPVPDDSEPDRAQDGLEKSRNLFAENTPAAKTRKSDSPAGKDARPAKKTKDKDRQKDKARQARLDPEQDAPAPEVETAPAETPAVKPAKPKAKAETPKAKTSASTAESESPAAAPVVLDAPEKSPDLKAAARLRKNLSGQLAAQPPVQAEVAQRSYGSFRETREELLQRLLDPQLSLEDAARILNVCPTTVRRYTNRGLLKHYRTAGNQRRFRLSDILEFLESHGAAGIDLE